MKSGQRVVITNAFHAHRGQGGIISTVATDEDGVMIFVTLDNNLQVMVEPSDIKVTK